MTGEGFFDATLVDAAWFDPALQDAGWMDPALVEEAAGAIAPARTVGTVAVGRQLQGHPRRSRHWQQGAPGR